MCIGMFRVDYRGYVTMQDRFSGCPTKLEIFMVGEHKLQSSDHEDEWCYAAVSQYTLRHTYI